MVLPMLSGNVTKVPLLVAPCFAQNKEFLHYIKYKLYDDGFIIVREESRFFNKEMAEKLCFSLDYTPPYFREGNKEASAEDAPELTANVGPSPSDMVGTAFVYILAHRDCHAKLLQFLLRLRTEDEMYATFLSNNGSASGPAAFFLPLWTNSTSTGAAQAVSLLFPQMLTEHIPSPMASREYVQGTLKRALLPALTELSKEKPADPIRWLAERLLETNTQDPPMVSHDER